VTGTVALTVLPVPTGYAGAVVGSNPAAFYRLGESSGSIARDAIGGRDGTYFNSTLGEPGYAPAVDADTAVTFGAVDSHVGNISGVYNWTGNLHTNFSIEFWAKGPAGQSDESTLVSRGIGASGTTPTEQFSIDVSGGVYRGFTRGGTTFYETFANVGPNDTWQHIVYVYDDLNVLGGGQVGYMYVNGELQNTGVVRPAGVRASTDPVSIGAKRLGNNPAYEGYFTGTIDEVAFYNRALTGSEVLAHYGTAYGPSTAPVIDLQPTSITNYLGLGAKVSVTAHGTVPLTYQWKRNGVDISGANSASYTINPLTLGDDANYSVGITNGINPGVVSGSAHIGVLAVPVTTVAIPGLVLHLPFDSNLTDTSGRGNSGTGIHLVQNLGVITSNTVAATYVPGQCGNGLHFVTTVDGTGTNWDNNYVSLGDRPDFHFSSNANFTVAFWVKNTDAVAAQWGDLPFLTTTVGSTFGTGLVFAWSYGTGATPWIGAWAFSMFDDGGRGAGGRGTQGTIDDGNWHHVAHVFDRKTGSTVYLDGAPATFNKQSGTSTKNALNIDTGDWLTIGQDPSGLYGEPGSGALDELGIWKRALSPLEVASIYLAGANCVSFTGAPFSLKGTKVGSNVVLSWDVGVLQEATSVNGPYVDLGVLSPLTVTPSGNKFYRIRL